MRLFRRSRSYPIVIGAGAQAGPNGGTATPFDGKARPRPSPVTRRHAPTTGETTRTPSCSRAVNLACRSPGCGHHQSHLFANPTIEVGVLRPPVSQSGHDAEGRLWLPDRVASAEGAAPERLQRVSTIHLWTQPIRRCYGCGISASADTRLLGIGSGMMCHRSPSPAWQNAA